MLHRIEPRTEIWMQNLSGVQGQSSGSEGPGVKPLEAESFLVLGCSI